jgi:hypothetical protein
MLFIHSQYELVSGLRPKRMYSLSFAYYEISLKGRTQVLLFVAMNRREVAYRYPLELMISLSHLDLVKM